MILNQKVEDLEEELSSFKSRQRDSEEAYENLLKSMGEKDKFTEDLINENVGLRLQLDQFMPKSKVPLRDILQEREAAALSKQREQSSSTGQN